MTDAGFRRFYTEQRIEGQRRYYEARAVEYEAANHQAVLWRNILLVAASIAGIVGTALSEGWRTGLGLTAAVCAALAAALAAYESLMGFGPNAELYREAAIGLDEVALDDDVEGPELVAQVCAVEELLRGENGHWGQLSREGVKPVDPAS
jgi:hypothetical protein